MPILPVLLLLAACAPVDWPDPPGDSGHVEAIGYAAAAFLIPVLLMLFLSHHTAKSLYELPAYHRRFARRYGRMRRLLHWVQLAVGILAVVWGWGWFVHRNCQVSINGIIALAPMAELLVPGPFLLGAWTCWLIHYDMMKAHHFAEASPGPVPPFWSRWGYFLHRFRRFALLILLPVVAFAAYQSAMRFCPLTVKSTEFQIGVGAAGLLLFLIMPRLAIPILGLKELPPGPHREHLESIGRRVNFRCGGLLLWPTHHTMANAMVLGVLPRLRYVIFTDLLLDRFDDEEIEAVLGHEIAHIKYRHMLYYAVFILLSLLVLFGFANALIVEFGNVPPDAEPPTWVAIPLLLVLLIYMFLVFGLVSRRCERQADLDGVLTVAGGRSDGHPLAAGVNAMTRALEKVAALNDMDTGRGKPSTFATRVRYFARDWQHGTFTDRIDFLQRLPYEPQLIEQTQQRVRRFQRLLLAGLVLALIVLGEWVGWKTLAGLL